MPLPALRPVRILVASSLPLLLAALAVYWFGFRPLRDPHPPAQLGKGVLALTGVRIYTDPDATALDDATLVIRDGRIAALGPGVAVPVEAVKLSCPHCVVTAGFWNAHVHLTEAKWAGAERAPAGQLAAQLADMFGRRGFTTVVDLGSNLRDTIPLRRRIEHGEIPGPRIYTAGGAQYPPHGIPYYLREDLAGWLLWFLAQPDTPEEAAAIEARNMANGADLLKLFTGSYVERGQVLPMPLANAQAAVTQAHQHGQLAFAHESDARGVRIALASGVDVLAHAADSTVGVDDALLQALVAHHVAMIPTLKMFETTVTRNPAYIDPILAQVRRFHALGGELLFGTDVGYMRDYDTTGEFQALVRCGLSGRDILRMLTQAPAARFHDPGGGALQVGQAADLTVLAGDPLGDPVEFAAVLYTVRNGRLIWRAPSPSLPLPPPP